MLLLSYMSNTCHHDNCCQTSCLFQSSNLFVEAQELHLSLILWLTPYLLVRLFIKQIHTHTIASFLLNLDIEKDDRFIFHRLISLIFPLMYLSLLQGML